MQDGTKARSEKHVRVLLLDRMLKRNPIATFWGYECCLPQNMRTELTMQRLQPRRPSTRKKSDNSIYD